MDSKEVEEASQFSESTEAFNMTTAPSLSFLRPQVKHKPIFLLIFTLIHVATTTYCHKYSTVCAPSK